MKDYKKKNFPVSEVRCFLEPGPVVLISSACKDEMNIMTLGWHTILEFTPSLVGCMITNANYSFEMIRKSGECVINLPTADLIEKVIGIGNCSGRDTDKFKNFSLTPAEATYVDAPLIKECFANFECKIKETKLVKDYNFFIFEILKAHVATSPKTPKTLHYKGDGKFMVSGKTLNRRRFFKDENL